MILSHAVILNVMSIWSIQTIQTYQLEHCRDYKQRKLSALMKNSWAFLKYWNLIINFSCISKPRECRNCNQNLQKRMNICICVIRNRLVFLLFSTHCMCGWCTPKQHFIAMTCDSKAHTSTLWPEISIKLNIDKIITGLQIMALNHEKI